MSKLEVDQVLRHFSHQHPLELQNLPPQSPQKTTCSCCKREASGWLYHCTMCNYSLHKPCSKFPQTLTHMVDKNHKLTLLPSPAYPECFFICNACGSKGTGFSYHCKDCQIDLHTICTFMPSKINHGAHNHTLNLCFSPPYEKKTFDCDICSGSGSDHWLYRCDSCEFDAHMKCAKAKTQPQTISATPKRQEKPNLAINHNFLTPQVPCDQRDLGIPYVQTQYNPIPGNGLFLDGSDIYPQINRNYVSVPILPNHMQPLRTNNLVNEVIGSAVEGITGAITQQVVQAFVQGALGNS